MFWSHRGVPRRLGCEGEMMRVVPVLAAVLAVGVAAASSVSAQQSTMPPDAKVYIIWPPDGARIKGGSQFFK